MSIKCQRDPRPAFEAGRTPIPSGAVFSSSWHNIFHFPITTKPQPPPLHVTSAFSNQRPQGMCNPTSLHVDEAKCGKHSAGPHTSLNKLFLQRVRILATGPFSQCECYVLGLVSSSGVILNLYHVVPLCAVSDPNPVQHTYSP